MEDKISRMTSYKYNFNLYERESDAQEAVMIDELHKLFIKIGIPIKNEEKSKLGVLTYGNTKTELLKILNQFNKVEVL